MFTGEYVVTLAYARFANASEPELVESFSVTVSEPVLRVEQGTAGTIFVKNNGVSMVDLHQWRLSYNGTVYTFPRYSMLKPKAKLAVPVAVFGVTSFTALPTLSNPSGSMVADGVAVQDPLGSSMISAQIRPVRNIVPAASPQVLGTNTVETAFATADETDTVPALKNNQRTWVFIALGALVAISVFLFLLLERFKARAE